MNFDHVAITVNDIGESVKWYVDRLNATIQYQDETWAMVQVGNLNVAMVLPHMHPPHFALEIKSIDAFPNGHEIKQHRDGSKYIYLSDPSGNVLELLHWPKPNV